ncbi:MAG: hypothetical protein Q9227_000169 [Pyrenula ochraceoflavens]
MDSDTEIEQVFRSRQEAFKYHTTSLSLQRRSCRTLYLSATAISLFQNRTTFPHISARKRPPLLLFLVILILFVGNAHAVFLPFDNCLDPARINSNPRQLQFVPFLYEAHLNESTSKHTLNATVYGNVTGLLTKEPYPAPDDPDWHNKSKTLGKIVDVGSADKFTTLFGKLNLLSYTPWNDAGTRFCESTVNTPCPVPPAFFVNRSDTARLPGFTVSHDLASSYAFTTLSETLIVENGDAEKTVLACVSASITPSLGSKLKGLLTYLPVGILIAVGVATVFAAIYSPWGSSDTFRWTTNYGRDEDLLRLVTPGFADCLNYIQFVVLTGSLSLNYPGFYQPVVQNVAWSALMFNDSFVTGGNGTRPVQDGIYMVNGTYGLDRMSQLVGMTSVSDVWAGMVIWTLVIFAAVLALTQVGFGLRWLHHQLSHIPEEDLRNKNLPFSVGQVIRVIFNYFLLPITSFSMFQFVIASRTPSYIVGLSALLIVLLVIFAAWFMMLLIRTRPRSYLFDDLPTVLTYGPLYNTFCDDAAMFALVPIFLNILRGIAIGALQASGIAQIIVLAICEVILALTLNAFRPFPAPTSMNIYHTCLAFIRLVTILLSIAFAPSLGVTEPTRGWLGYVLLLMHGATLIFGFLLNALLTIVEVVARLAGAGGESGGPTRGGLVKVLGKRQLARRTPRAATRSSYAASDAAMLGPENDQKSFRLDGGRSRSMSASSRQLLNSDGRNSLAFADNASAGMGHSRASGSGGFHPSTPLSGSNFSRTGASSRQSTGQILGLKDPSDPYYRRPRERRNTIDPLSPGVKSRESGGSSDYTKSKFTEMPSPDEGPGEGPSGSGRASPVGRAAGHSELDDIPTDYQGPRPDYSVREVDFYYGVRGPALKSTGGTRKLKTGPADPTGPVSSATGWFRGLFGGKTKDKAKGFEVVRSARAPPPGLMPEFDREAGPSHRPYRDNPDSASYAGRPSTVYEARPSRDLTESHDDEAFEGPSSEGEDDSDERPVSRISPEAPSLPALDTGGGIEMPSRIGSRASKKATGNGFRSRPPTVPRRSSKRNSLGSSGDFPPSSFPTARLSAVAPSPSRSSASQRRLYNPNEFSERHLGPSPGRFPFDSTKSPAASTTSSNTQVEPEESSQAVEDRPHHTRHSSSALGGLAPDIRADRPSSVGFVPQHRASENIHEASPDSADIVESSAEFVGRAQ